MKLRKFDTYEQYVRSQTETNKRKIDHVWVREKELHRISDDLTTRVVSPKFGICHGVRNGFEVKVLRQILDCNVIGTEISDTATQFENVVQWDFHERNADWQGKCDFVYSNSWDHSYDPFNVFKTWGEMLNPQGVLYLQWTRNHLPKSVYGADCFGIDLKEFKEFLAKNFDILRVMRFNKLYMSEALGSPKVWLKGVVAPIRVIVAKPRRT